jgi:hypothetical protein
LQSSAGGPASTSNSDAPDQSGPADAAVGVQRTAVGTPSEQDTAILTFLDGEPLVTACLEINEARRPTPPSTADWSRASPRHTIAIEQARESQFALVHRDCYVVMIRGADISRGEQRRVDMQRARRLRVNLRNEPAGLRDKVDLFVKVNARCESEAERLAQMLMRLDSKPVVADFIDLPLAHARDGHVHVDGFTKVSRRGFAVKDVPFAASDVSVDVDLSGLQRWASLCTLQLALDFPYAHPAGRLGMSLILADGSSISGGEIERRPGQRETTLVFNDLPPGMATPTIRAGLGAPVIHLDPIEIRGDVSSRRTVEAEGVLCVTVQAQDAGDLRDCYLFACNEHGLGIGGWRKVTHQDSVVFLLEHLPASTYHVQVHDEGRGYRACSRMARIKLETATVQDLSLVLVPSGKVDLERNGAPETGFVDLRSSTGESGRYFLHFLGRDCVSLACPAGDYEAVLGDEVRCITVSPGATVSLRFSK